MCQPSLNVKKNTSTASRNNPGSQNGPTTQGKHVETICFPMIKDECFLKFLCDFPRGFLNACWKWIEADWWQKTLDGLLLSYSTIVYYNILSYCHVNICYWCGRGPKLSLHHDENNLPVNSVDAKSLISFRAALPCPDGSWIQNMFPVRIRCLKCVSDGFSKIAKSCNCISSAKRGLQRLRFHAYGWSLE